MPGNSVRLCEHPKQLTMQRFAVVVLVALVGTAWANTPFPEFQDRFAEHSQLVEPQLQELRAENNEARLEVVNLILTRLANLTVDLRQLSWDTWETIENSEDANEECLDLMRDTFDYYLWIAEVDIMDAAGDMNYYMRRDAAIRFNPRAFFKSRENTRAIYQTVQTLGRNRFMDNLGDTLFELEDELNYFQNLWDSYQEVLREEIGEIEPFREFIEEEMDWWYEFAMRWHSYFMQMMIENIEYYC